MRRSALINVMVKAADKAGRQLVRDFGDVEHLTVSRKGPADFVSQADQRAEQIILEVLNEARPEFAFFGEESGQTGPEEPEGRWIVDPLDGTTNYLHGLPHWSISIALEQTGGIVAGVVFDPIKDELFWAERGQGAYLGARQLRVSRKEEMSESLFASGMPFCAGGATVEPYDFCLLALRSAPLSLLLLKMIVSYSIFKISPRKYCNCKIPSQKYR